MWQYLRTPTHITNVPSLWRVQSLLNVFIAHVFDEQRHFHIRDCHNLHNFSIIRVRLQFKNAIPERPAASIVEPGIVANI